MQSIILVYIKETDGRQADDAIQSLHRMRGNERRPRNAIRFESRMQLKKDKICGSW